MDESLLKLMKKVYYVLVYPDQNYYAALDRESGYPYKVDDISLAWLRRDPYEFQDFCRHFPELKVMKVTFTLEPYEE